MLRKTITCTIILAIILSAAASVAASSKLGKVPSHAKKTHAEYAEGELLVKFKETADISESKIQKKFNFRKAKKLSGKKLYRVSVSKDNDIKKIVNALKKHPDVEYAEPNYIYTVDE